MALPALTREYTPGSRCNSREIMRLPPQQETRPDSLVLRAQQFHVHNKARKERWFSWWNSRGSPRTPSQVKNGNDFSKGKWNCSLYPKSTRDEARITSIGSTAISHSPSYKTGGLSYFRPLQRFPETPISNLEEHQFQHRNSRKAPWMPYHLEKWVDSQDSIEEVGHLSTRTSRELFPQQ